MAFAGRLGTVVEDVPQMPSTACARDLRALHSVRRITVLLDCARAADALGKTFALRHVPPQLAALAGLYGVDTVLMAEPEVAPAPATP